MSKVPHLRLLSDGAPPLTLALTQTPQPAGPSPAQVYADRQYVFELADFELGAFTATLLINGEVVPCQPVQLEDGTLRLVPSSMQKTFSDFFGLLQIDFIIAKAGLGTSSLYAEPVSVMLPEGPVSQNLATMGDVIAARWTPLIGQGSEHLLAQQDKKDALTIREEILDDILRVYESQYAYFRSNARFKLRAESTVDGSAKLRHFSADTARFIATHPEELVEAPAGTGVQIGNRHYLPIHTLVKRNVRDHGTAENQVLLGFLTTVLRGLEREKTTVTDLLAQTDSGNNRYVSSGRTLFGSASERLRNYRDKLHAIENRIREIAVHYRTALGIEGLPVVRIPEPTPVFLSIPAYRLVFDVIVRWFEAGELELEAEEALIASMKQSRLYEYFVLFTLIDALLDEGAGLVERRNHQWSGGNAWNHVQTDHPNTFVFEYPNRRITLYYQPFIASHDWTGENALALMRTSSWSIDGGVLHQSANLIYTPDFLIQVEREGETVCFILDAKFSSLRSVRMYQSAGLVFRYLFSIGPAKPNTRVEGLWLFCGNALRDGEEDAACLADIPVPAGAPLMPNVHFGKADGVNHEATRQTVEQLIARILKV